MCNPASFVVVKENGGLKCLWHPDVSDSHEDIIDFYKLKETNVREEITLVRVEIYPPNNNYTLPLDKWRYELDQDMLPPWYDAGKVEAACRLELVAWLAAKVVLPGEVREKVEGKTHLVVVYGTISHVGGSATIFHVCGSATISRVYGSATIFHVCGSATISRVYGSAKISHVCGSATISHVCGSATISRVYGSAKISHVCGSATISHVCGSATISHVCGSATISRVCGSATISRVYGSAKISHVCGSAKISHVCGSATISHVCWSATISHVCGSATIVKDER